MARLGRAQPFPAHTGRFDVYPDPPPPSVELKTINGKLWASQVKTVNGLAQAGVKRVNGVLANT